MTRAYPDMAEKDPDTDEATEVSRHEHFEVADAVKALALVVGIATAWVRVPRVAPTKMDVGKAPCTEGAPMIQTGRQWKTSSR